MNRRNFIGTVLAIGAGFSILPGAGRLWMPIKKVLPVTLFNPTGTWGKQFIILRKHAFHCSAWDNPEVDPKQIAAIYGLPTEVMYEVPPIDLMLNPERRW